MQKTTQLCVMVMLCLLGNLPLTTLHAQNTAIQPLTIGDVVPDIEFTNMVNYHQPTARLSDFKGKLVILDFWATWCAPCVKGLPMLSKLQQKYAQQLAVIPISDENAAGVKNFLARRSNIQLPSAIITGDERSRIQQWLPYTTIPHAVIISPQGKVLALTTSAFITDSLIALALNNQPLQLTVKKELPGYNHNTPFFVNNNAGADINDIAFQSLITRYLPGPGGTRIMPVFNSMHNKTPVGFHITNLPIIAMLNVALNVPSHYCHTRLVLEQVRDSSKYLKGTAGAEWNIKNNYCYEIIMPGATKPQMRSVMKSDIERYFGIVSSIQKKTMPCYVIKQITEKAIAASATKYIGGIYTGDSIIYANVPVQQVVIALEKSMLQPVVIDTDTTLRVNLRMPGFITQAFRQNPGNPAPLLNYLKEQGIVLQSALRQVDVMVIKEISLTHQNN